MLVEAALLREVALARLDPVGAVFLLGLVGLAARRGEWTAGDAFRVGFCEGVDEGLGCFISFEKKGWERSFGLLRLFLSALAAVHDPRPLGDHARWVCRRLQDWPRS